MEELDVGAPVVAVLFEPSRGKAFAFGETFYRELKANAPAIPCANIRGQGTETAAAMGTLVNCARVLQNSPASRP
jgi:hypothetical protein